MEEITRQVGASSDDCYRRLTTSFWNLEAVAVIAGAVSTSLYRYGSGMRFTNITIPNGAVIIEAHLALRAKSSQSGTVLSRISAEDVDNAVTFADNAGAFDTRWAARTTARVDWDNIQGWTMDEDYDSLDIKTVIKEIVDRGGWVSGQDIVIFWEDFEDRTPHGASRYRQAYSYNGSVEFAPKLVIQHGVAGWTGKISGVTNPAKIMGVDVANIAKVKGVA